MKAQAYLRGREIAHYGGQWRYLDTGGPTADNPRSCGNCINEDRDDGHDACLGNLLGIMNACCGHGEINKAYVQFLDGSVICGEDALTILSIMKRELSIK